MAAEADGAVPAPRPSRPRAPLHRNEHLRDSQDRRKQYRVEQGLTLLVERLPADDGETVALEPLLYVDGSTWSTARICRGLGRGRVVAHERGPKLRVVKFKPKRGYKRRTGHRQNLTRIEVTSLGRPRAGEAVARRAKAADPAAEEATMAHKKGLGSSRNGRDSNAKRLGVKVFAGEAVTGGEIIVRQRGTQFKPGDGAGIGKDDTIYAEAAGTVQFTRGRRGRVISIVPGDSES